MTPSPPAQRTRHSNAFRRRFPGAMAALLTCLLPLSAAAAAPGPAVKTEIDTLLAYLDKSGCRFFRNGTWYVAAEARAHVAKKYQYLLGKGQIVSTEAFIDKAASESSISGKPYLVQCGDAAAVESGRWFKDELTRLRSRRPT